MESVSQTLKTNLKIMNSRVTKHAIYGVLIAVVALVLATLISCHMQYAAIT
ncbi:MAG: GGDEF-domain containing protein, partial [Thermodesulfobacteriota bacterium]|nr:GGDEF-domain containing protein [Thermodesulfobacteriota bacterium]